MKKKQNIIVVVSSLTQPKAGLKPGKMGRDEGDVKGDE